MSNSLKVSDSTELVRSPANTDLQFGRPMLCTTERHWTRLDSGLSQIQTGISNSDLDISMETRILRLEDEFWRIRTDTGELAETERNALNGEEGSVYAVMEIAKGLLPGHIGIAQRIAGHTRPTTNRMIDRSIRGTG
jgi:hypothetical protein